MGTVSALCLSVVYIVGVFFFKQKTAYEMRISDWSSDVCSSDLGVTRNPLADPGILGIQAGSSLAVVVAIYVFDVSTLSSYVWFAFQIGRASCRERVCQYV